ncbi:MAG: hypothetical protein NC548_32260 [Lachnospiraceae bacterium]|nr:hypothetical protein [Lachnospiraceae bacterium]
MALTQQDLMPAGMSGPNGMRFAAWLMDLYKSGQIDSQNLANLQNIQMATGENLRRIGYLLGFNFITTNDDLYRKNLLAFVVVRRCNGSIGGMYNALRIYGFKTDKIDIYNSFSYTAGVLLDGTRVLDGRWQLNNDYDRPLFSNYIDFYRSNGVTFFGADDLVEFCRAPGRPLLAREIFVVEAADAVPASNELILDGSWQLDGTYHLDPFATPDKAQLLRDGTVVAESAAVSPSVRLSDCAEFTFASFAQFDEIRILANNQVIAKKIYNLTQFYFKIQIVQWIYSPTGGVRI